MKEALQTSYSSTKETSRGAKVKIVLSQPFKNLMGTFGCVSRGENTTITARVTKARENECQGTASTTYRQHRICNEGSNHSDMHIGIGPTMADVSLSPAE